MKYLSKLHIFLVIFLVTQSVCSIWLIWENANDEPYLGLTKYGAYTQIILGTTFILLWVEFIIVVIYFIYRKMLSVEWVVIIVWALMVLFYLQFCPFGYIGDIIKLRDIFNDFPITNTSTRIGSYYDQKDT